MFLLVPAYPGCPGSKAIKRSLLMVVVICHNLYHSVVIVYVLKAKLSFCSQMLHVLVNNLLLTILSALHVVTAGC